MRTLVLALLLLVPFTLAQTVDAKKMKKPKRGLQIRTQPYTVEAGADREWCEYRRLPGKKPLDVVGFETSMPVGAHHFVLWGYGGDEQDDSKFPAGPVESVGCAGLGPGDLVPRVIIPLQSPNQRFDLPKGIAIRLNPGEQLWLNPHLKNFGDVDMTPDVRMNLYRAKKGTVKHYAEGLIAGNMPDIDIPPNGEQTLTVEWTLPATLNFVLLTSHQHSRGTYSNIEVVSPEGQPTLIYESYDWEHPPNLWYDQPLRLEKGRKLRLTCTWQNPEARPVYFGPNTTDEMCFMLGFYYRDDGDTAEIPFGQCLPAKTGLFCPLAPKVN